MDKVLQALKSRTVWTVVVIVLLNSVTELRELLPSDGWLDTVNGILLAIAAYFRVNPKS